MEKTIEIPFGAKDSELKGWEYTIPEGMEAEIKDGKIIVKQKKRDDDKIRKEMIEFLTYGIWSETTIDKIRQSQKYAKWVTYLERQKEHKSVQDREEREYVRTLKSLIADFLCDKEDVNRGYYQDIYDWLDGRHIEQQPANDRYMEGYAKGYKDAENSYNRAVSYHLDTNVINDAPIIDESMEDKDAIELTPKQDYSGLTDFERAIHRGFLCAGVENVPVGIIKETAEDCLAHIKPAEWSEEEKERIRQSGRLDVCYNPEKYGLCHKEEWSEEDETAFGDLMWCIEQASKSAKNENDMGNIWFAENWVKNRLKSLRPQPHWKPSEEQIYSLGTVVKGYDNCTIGSVGYNLKELYEQLKKL